MNNVEYNRPGVRLALFVEKAKVNGVEHHRECFEEDEDQHQIVNFEDLKMIKMINYSNAIWQATDEIIEADGFGDYKRKKFE